MHSQFSECTANAHYMENTIKDVILAGISDIDIRRETLTKEKY